MNLEKLKILAKISIEKHAKSLFPKPNKAVIQIVQEKQLAANFPFDFQYIGMLNGKYVYNLDAQQVLKLCERFELEW